MKLAQYEALLADLAVELQRYLISRGALADVAADIVQDMFVKVLEADLILPPDKLRPYLYRVAWSTYLDDYRHRQRWKHILIQYLGPGLTQIVEAPHHNGEDPKLVRALARLSSQDQELLCHRYVAGWSLQRLANERQTTVAAIKMRLHRLRRRLKKQLRGEI